MVAAIENTPCPGDPQTRLRVREGARESLKPVTREERRGKDIRVAAHQETRVAPHPGTWEHVSSAYETSSSLR